MLKYHHHGVVTSPNFFPLPAGHRNLGWLLLRLFWVWIGVLLLLLGGCTFPALYPVTLIAAECPLPVPEELEEGRTITCGYLQVPQDRAAPAALQVTLPYAHIRAESVHPHPDPLVYIVGGPGGSALAEFNQVYAWFRPMRRDRDLILYDQRGTLLADPVLECVRNDLSPTDAEIDSASRASPSICIRSMPMISSLPAVPTSSKRRALIWPTMTPPPTPATSSIC